MLVIPVLYSLPQPLSIATRGGLALTSGPSPAGRGVPTAES